jgi:Fe-Mn family superoxide dismutase
MTVLQNRREMFALAAGAALVATATSALAQNAPKVEYTPAKMPFDPTKVKGLSERLLRSHFDNNYTGAVRRLTAINAQLSELDFAKAPVFVVNGLKREELVATNSMIIHELYFDCLGGEGDPKGALAEQIARDFGSLARWKTEFSATGKALGGGSGWVMLTWSPRDKRLVNTWAADHTMTLANGRPILALDMFEHAYQMDYGARAAAYVDAFMEGIRWQTVAARFESYSKQG